MNVSLNTEGPLKRPMRMEKPVFSTKLKNNLTSSKSKESNKTKTPLNPVNTKTYPKYPDRKNNSQSENTEIFSSKRPPNLSTKSLKGSFEDFSKKIPQTNFKANLSFSTSSLTKSNIKTSRAVSSSLKIPQTQVGQVLDVKIDGVGPGNLGFVEMANGFTIFVPKANFGDKLQIEIKQIQTKKSKYAIAKILKVLDKTNKIHFSKKEKIQKIGPVSSGNLLDKPDVVKQRSVFEKVEKRVSVGDQMTVTIEKAGPKQSGLVFYKNFTLIVLKTDVGQKVPVEVIRVKEKYAFAKVLKLSLDETAPFDSFVKLGFKYTMNLPKTAHYVSNYMLVRLQNKLVFLKMGLGAKLGDLVQVQITKVGPSFAVAKILKLSPMSKQKKQILIKQRLKNMFACGMHFGEKAICGHANMKKSIWLNDFFKKPSDSAFISTKIHQTSEKRSPNETSVISKEPTKKRPLIRKGRHLINLFKTRRCLNKVLIQLSKYAAKGHTFLFVGTKKSASTLIARAATLSKTAFFVNTRWLGGMLTNWKTILKSISQIRSILKKKQNLIEKILKRRQKMKRYLISKVNLLRKKSEKLVLKGKNFLTELQKNKPHFLEKSQILLAQKIHLLEKNQKLLLKYESLRQKKQIFSNQCEFLTQKGNHLLQEKTLLLRQFNHFQTQVSELKPLFYLGQEILKIHQTAHEEGKSLKLASFQKLMEKSIYHQFDEAGKQISSEKTWILPNPSTILFEKMVVLLKANYSQGNVSMFFKPTNFHLSNQKDTFSNQPKTDSSKNILVLSKLVHKFTRMLPFLKKYLENLTVQLQQVKTSLITIYQQILKVRQQLQKQAEVLKTLRFEWQFLNFKFRQEKKRLTSLKIQLRRLASEQRLLKFLPRLRYLPTPANKMAETIQILMKKLVDPKLISPMDQVYEDKLKHTPKKIAAIRKQKWQRLERYFGGIAKMAKMKKKQLSKNVAIIIGQKEEMNAIRECQKFKIPIFSILDTNHNPHFANHWIPANDESRNSVKYILKEMLKRICLAQKLRQKLALRQIRKTSKTSKTPKTRFR
jgi:small subunit ribosomal protein S2